MEAIWIDPSWIDRHGWQRGWEVVTKATTNTSSPAIPMDEEQIRKIVRQEIAELPIPFEVPDAGPEN